MSESTGTGSSCSGDRATLAERPCVACPAQAGRVAKKPSHLNRWGQACTGEQDIAPYAK